MELVSIIIPTYNRFKYLQNVIKYLKQQTYNNIEIIVINDGSSEKEYYNYDWNNIKIIHLKENSKIKFGHGCPGHVRNQGINIANGKYIAFCDDDDIWLPNKLALQIEAMKDTKCKMSCTEGLIGKGIYEPKNQYKKYNSEYYYNKLKEIYKNKNSNLIDNGFPKIWDYNFLKIHNCCITSSTIIDKDILKKVNNMGFKRRGQDYLCWLNVLQHTNCVYISVPCVYYDLNHGYGKNH